MAKSTNTAKSTDIRVDTWDAGIDFPIFDAKTRSLKKAVLGAAGYRCLGASATLKPPPTAPGRAR